MPGRGRPWKGVGEGNPDRIGTGAIADGSITEADLDSSVTAKLNSAGGHEIQDEGTPLVQRANLNFIGAGVVASDGIEDTTNITIAGGGGGGAQEDLGTPNDNFWIYDEFFYPVFTDIDHLEHSENSASIPSNNVGGVVQQNTTAVANGLTRLNTCGAGLATVDSTKKVIVRWRNKLTIADENTSMICGLTKPNDGPQSTFPFGNKFFPIITFFWTGTGNIDTYSDDGTSVEQTDTGVAMDTNFHTYDIEFDPSGTPTITYKIDGAIVKTQTTNIPTGNMACYNACQTGTTAVRSIQTDSWFLFNDR